MAKNKKDEFPMIKDKPLVYSDFENDKLFDNNIEEVEEHNIISEVIKNLDSDIEQADGMTSIDFNSDLTDEEIASIVPLQMLHSFRLSGRYASILARSIKRHKVSRNRRGREEKVKIIQGERDHENAKNDSFLGKVRGIFNQNET